MRIPIVQLAFFIAFAALASAETPLVKTEGLLSGAYQDDVDAVFICLVIERGGTFTYAFFRTNDTSQVLKDLQPLVGRHISVTGREFVPHPLNRAVTKRQIRILSLDDVRIASGAQDDLFDAPLIDKTPMLAELVNPTPRRTVGTVTARWQNKVMLQNADGESLIAELHDGIDLPAIGESIEVAGSPVTDLYRIHLVGSIWRKSNERPVTQKKPLATTLEAFFKDEEDGEFILNPKLFGCTLVVNGTLREFVMDENGEKRLLLENGGYTVQIDCSNAPTAAMTELGSQIQVTGVYVLNSDFWSPAMPFPKNKNLFLVARSDDDIRVIKGPAWWTPVRFLIAASIMAGIIVAILLWNAALRILVERKSREVVKAQARKLESELRIAERTRLAADLHDSLSQNLTVIGYQVSNARNTLGDKDPATTDLLVTASKMISSCRIDLRRCLWDLRSDVLDETDFAEAIRKTVAPVAESASIAVRFVGSRAAISDSTAHGVLNAIRELVANAVRHGSAAKIRIAGEIRAGALNISVRDDGCGFDLSSRPGQNEGHFGLDGIVERIERIGGAFEIDSSPGKGTYARIIINRPSAEPHTLKTQ